MNTNTYKFVKANRLRSMQIDHLKILVTGVDKSEDAINSYNEEALRFNRDLHKAKGGWTYVKIILNKKGHPDIEATKKSWDSFI